MGVGLAVGVESGVDLSTDPSPVSVQPADSSARMRMAVVRGLVIGCMGKDTVLKRFKDCDYFWCGLVYAQTLILGCTVCGCRV